MIALGGKRCKLCAVSVTTSLLAMFCFGQTPERSCFATPQRVRSFTIHKHPYISSDGLKFSPDENKEFRRLFEKGVFVTGRYSFNWYTVTINAHKYLRTVPHFNGAIMLEGMLFPLHVLASYDPFSRVLFISDDEYDDYGNGLVISNVPPALMHFHKLDSEYPAWMEADVSLVKQRLNGLELEVSFSTFHPDGHNSTPFYYLAPYLFYTFGTNVCLKSDTLTPCGKDFQFVGPSSFLTESDKLLDGTWKTKHDLKIGIGATTLNVDSKNYLTDSFFIALTNAIVQAADAKRALNSRKCQ